MRRTLSCDSSACSARALLELQACWTHDRPSYCDMLHGQSCPMLPAPALGLLRMRVCSSPQPLQHSQALLSTSIPLLDWRLPLLRPSALPAATISPETHAAEPASPDLAEPPARHSFEALGLDGRLTVRRGSPSPRLGGSKAPKPDTVLGCRQGWQVWASRRPQRCSRLPYP